MTWFCGSLWLVEFDVMVPLQRRMRNYKRKLQTKAIAFFVLGSSLPGRLIYGSLRASPYTSILPGRLIFRSLRAFPFFLPGRLICGSLRVTFPNLESQNSVFFYCGIKYGNLHADVSISDGSQRKIILLYWLANLTANVSFDNHLVFFFLFQKLPLSLLLL